MESEEATGRSRQGSEDVAGCSRQIRLAYDMTDLLVKRYEEKAAVMAFIDAI
jgi:hypothetical protein